MPETDLSVVVPVYNAADTLQRLTQEVLSTEGCTPELIFVDDCSPDGSADILDALATSDPRVTVLRHPVNRGAGPARDTGFARARGTYTLFFDADDHLHPTALAEGIRQLKHTGADLAMLPYANVRDGKTSGQPMWDHDTQIWTTLTGGRPVTELSTSQARALLLFTNYPWNKIVHTERQRRAGLRFGSTQVHNDILGHWLSLMQAERVLLIDQVICTHTVLAAGGNLTNQRDRRRLVLFDALEELLDVLEARPGMRQHHARHYWEFALDLAAWGRGRIASELHLEFRDRLQNLAGRMDLEDYAQMRRGGHPALANRLSRILLRSG